MNRFARDLDLSYLVGRELVSISIDQFAIRLVLSAEVLSADRRSTGVLDNVVMDSDVFIRL